MSTISPRMAAALDDAVERLTKVLLKWGEDSRGPSNSWTLGLSETIASLVRSRVALESNQDTKPQ